MPVHSPLQQWCRNNINGTAHRWLNSIKFSAKRQPQLFDRGYPSYTLMYMLNNQESARHFLMRCKTSFSNEIETFVNSRKSSKTITIYPSKEAIEQLRGHGYIVSPKTELKIRLVKVKLPDGETEILLTNLYDAEIYTVSMLKALYFIRWKIETTFDKQKNQIQMEIFSGHKIICIQQDYAAGLFVSNLQSLIEKQSDDYLRKISEHRMYAYKVNRNISWSVLKNKILEIFITQQDSMRTLVELQKAFERNLEPVRFKRHNPRPPTKKKKR